uniref:ARAD1A19712p n=1 Tax=Blastobotrys adeninivorans TaxID=409370 RepID=A0A060T3X5_BLAAD
MSPPQPPQVPQGWLAKFDENYKTFYYVDLSTGKSQWEKPPGTQEAGPPQGPPPSYNQSHQPAGAGDHRGAPGGYPPQQGYGGYPPQGGYGGYPPQGGYGGYPPQGYGGGYPPQGYGGYPPQQPQVMQQQPGRSRKNGMMGGMGGMALGAGAGLLGGAMLANAFDGPDVVENNYYGDDYGGDMGDMGDMGGDF